MSTSASKSGRRGKSRAHDLSGSLSGGSARHKRWPGDGYQQHATSWEKNILDSKSTTTTKHSLRMEGRTELRENIVRKPQRQKSDDELEMAILKTQEIQVLYSPKQEEHTVSETPMASRREHYLDRPEWRQDAHIPSRGVVEVDRIPPAGNRTESHFS